MTNWLDRSLILGPFFCLVRSEEEYNAALDDIGIPKSGRDSWIKNDHSHATMHTLENPKDGGLVCIVALSEEAAAKEPIAVAGLLVHEAVHVFQRWCQRVGETEPSMEFEAYSIQWIAQQLMWSYRDDNHG